MAERREQAFPTAIARRWLMAAMGVSACHGPAPREAYLASHPSPRDAGSALLPAPAVSGAEFANPSQWVAIGQRRMHLRCMGSGSPIIVLEAGLGGDSSGWVRVQPRLARLTRVCSYDRAGYYFSDPGPMPRTADVALADLRALVEGGALRPPFVLVGHSLGGLLARLYAATYPGDVAGMVLLDPVLDDIEDERSAKDAELGEEDPLFVKCLAAARNKTITSDTTLQQECIGSPDARLSRELNAAQAEAASRVATWETMLAEGKEMRSGRTGARVRAAQEKLENLPLLVVTKGRIRTTPPDEAKIAQAHYGRIVLRHAELAARSQRGLHLIARSGHQIHMDDPDTVVAGVQAVVRAYRENSAVMP
jgi:pimeloyl-ACP methyl ester carboxylesterase